MSAAQTLNETSFDTTIADATTPVLVDFWAEWCGPCKMLAPTLDALAADYAGKLTVGKVNVDECQILAERYGIRGIPTLLLFVGGEMKEQVVGVQSKQLLAAMIDKYL